MVLIIPLDALISSSKSTWLSSNLFLDIFHDHSSRNDNCSWITFSSDSMESLLSWITILNNPIKIDIFFLPAGPWSDMQTNFTTHLHFPHFRDPFGDCQTSYHHFFSSNSFQLFHFSSDFNNFQNETILRILRK